MSQTKPILGLTMGDPAGVGPEIIVGAWAKMLELGTKQKYGQEADTFLPHAGAKNTEHSADFSANPNEASPLQKPLPRLVALGHPRIFERAASLLRLPIQILPISSLSQLPNDPDPNLIPCLNCCQDDAALVAPGEIDPRGGEAAFAALNKAIDLALAHEIDAIVTGPLHKKSMNLAGHHYPGHTEILADRCHVDDFAMMLYLGPQETLASPDGLAVVHVTLHTAMKNVFEQITLDSVRAKCHLIHHFMKTMKNGREPKIGVCALNCHNGENGLFGDEEIRVIRPAVELVRSEGVEAEGPFPSDTLMLDAKNGRFDGIVAMIHDQGHIAVKLLNMHRAVNITLGLPIIRTSVAHGTAFDKAWQGIAKTTSLIEAARVALHLIRDTRSE